MNKQQKIHLIRSAHTLNPTVTIAQKGLIETVVSEIEASLTAHELIKIKFAGYDKTEKLSVAQSICKTTQAELIQIVGHIGTFYRPKPVKKKKVLAKKKSVRKKPLNKSANKLDRSSGARIDNKRKGQKSTPASPLNRTDSRKGRRSKQTSKTA